MFIVIIQGAFLPVPPVQGGAVEKIWFSMGKEFAALGHRVVHISRSVPGFPDTEDIDGVQHLRVKGFDTPSSLLKLKVLDLFYSLRAVKKLPKEADVIVTNTFWSPFLLRGKTGGKVYVDVQRVPKGQMKFYLHTGKLRGCSPAICNAIKREIPKASDHKVTYVPNPVPFTVKERPLLKEKIILFVGRLHPEKGVDTLIKAFGLLDNKLSKDWKLVVVGPSEFKDGGGGAAYLKQLMELASHKNIEFTGPVFDEDSLIDYYAKASIFCYPAQGDSGDAAPVAPREAMAYGCVPVVSKLECFNDVIFHGENGLCFNEKSIDQPTELMNQIRLLIEDNTLLESLSAKAKLVASNFSAKKIAKMFIDDFGQIIENNK